MTVLFVDHASGLGGAEQSLLMLLEHLDRQRWQPELASAGGPLAARATALGVPVHRVALPRLRPPLLAGLTLWRQASVLATVARRRGAWLIHANTVRAAMYCAMASRLSGIPWLWHMRDFWLSETEPRLPLVDAGIKRALSRSALQVVANSRAVAGRLPGRATVIHNGIDISRYDPSLSGRACRERWGIPRSSPVVGMVGRLRPWKGQETFLRVAAHVRESIPAVRFVVVGGAPITGSHDDYTKRLRQLQDHLGLDDTVIFTGHLKDIPPALAAFDLFVHPGAPEPFGLVTVEAMAMGRPVVAFSHGALPEIMSDGQTGRLVAPLNAEAMAVAIVELLNDSQAARDRLGRAGRNRVRTLFDIQRTVTELGALYSHIRNSA